MKMLDEIGRGEPQAAYSTFAGGFEHKVTCKIHTTPDLEKYMQELDKVIDTALIIIVTEEQCSTDERRLLSLPAKIGGLAILVFSTIEIQEHKNSQKVTQQLQNNIRDQKQECDVDNESFFKTKRSSKYERSFFWLTTLPLKSENVVLNKRELLDAINL